MGRTPIWITAWLALTGAASLLHRGDMPGVQNLAADLPTYLPSLLLGAAGQFCLWRAIRSGIGEMWGGLWGSKRPTSRRPRSSGQHEQESASEFDADAAFARYMERRASQAGEENVIASPSPALTPRPPAAGGFGRKLV